MGHPDTGAYDVDSQLAADELNVLNRTVNRDTMTGSEVLNEIDKTEFNAKTDPQKQMVWDIVHLGTVNPFGVESELLTDIFGGGSNTITALAAARKTTVSRATELSFGRVRAGDITYARAL